MLPLLLAQATDSATDFSDTASDLSTAASDIATTQAATAVAAGSTAVFGGMIIVWIIVALVSVFFLIWWIILLMDLMKRDFPQKQTYMILMILSFFFGFMWLMDLIYYFGVVKKGVGKGAAVAPVVK